MRTVVAVALCAVLAALAAIHFYWAAGGRVALAGAVPSDGEEPLFRPGRGMTAVVGVALVAAAGVVALRGGLLSWPVPSWLPVVGTWVLALVFAARALGDFRYVGFFKTERGTLFALRDTRVYSPLCAVLSLLAAALNLVGSER